MWWQTAVTFFGSVEGKGCLFPTLRIIQNAHLLLLSAADHFTRGEIPSASVFCLTQICHLALVLVPASGRPSSQMPPSPSVLPSLFTFIYLYKNKIVSNQWLFYFSNNNSQCMLKLLIEIQHIEYLKRFFFPLQLQLECSPTFRGEYPHINNKSQRRASFLSLTLVLWQWLLTGSHGHWSCTSSERPEVMLK